MSSKSAMKLLAVVGVWGMSLIAMAAPPKGSPTAGKKIYEGTCQICHGPTGKGVSAMATHLATPADLSGRETQGKTDEELRRIIQKGHGTEMVGYERVFKEAEIDDVVAYIRSFKR
jgi:mono/diheme cytochrome c family protein